MIIGAHSIIYSREPDRDRSFPRDVLELPSVDVGGGWLIFGLPPAEVAVHPSEQNDVHEFYLLTDDVGALIARLKQQSIDCSAPRVMSWGLLTHITLPGGGKLGIYEPRHARPEAKRPKAKIKPRVVRRSKPKSKTRPRKSARGRRTRG